MWTNRFDLSNPTYGGETSMFNAMEGSSHDPMATLSYLAATHNAQNPPDLDLLDTMSDVESTTSFSSMFQEKFGTAVSFTSEMLDNLSPLEGLSSSLSQGVQLTKDIDALSDAKAEYTNQMDYGHGIGFAQVAQNNMNSQLQGITTYNAVTNTANSLFAPLGLGLSTILSPSMFDGPTDNSFMAEDTSGNMVNAQSQEIIDNVSTS